MYLNPVLKDIHVSIASGSINLSRYTFLEPISIGYLAIACKENNFLVNQKECSGNAASFLSRLNFYNYVGLNDPFGQSKYAGNNRNTLEINEANNSNNQVYDKVNDILSSETTENIQTVERLLSELITNVEMYAEYGVVVGQVINRVFHLVVVDKGPGIATHLKSKLSQYANMSNQDIILESLKKGVTSGRGRGFGLWQTHEVLKRNQGILIIRSENQIVDCISGNCYVADSPWVGTSIELRYNLDKPVDFDDILGIQNLGGVSDEFGF